MKKGQQSELTSIEADGQSSTLDIFRAFLKLGLSSFGGPIAHVGYMREEFVAKRKWLDDAHFAQLLAICQFLPGPASSQLGFAIGLLRGGWRGALAAFVAFTLPSVLLMFGLVALMPSLTGSLGGALVHGLKLVAVVVIAHGLMGMIRQLTPDLTRILIGIAAAALIIATGNVWMQLLAIAFGAVMGSLFCKSSAASKTTFFAVRYGTRIAAMMLAIFLLGLGLALLFNASQSSSVGGISAAFYRAGALVFGGGHVVLPLLQSSVVDSGWLSQETFLAGYGAAQAMPGPMFSMAAFLGAEINTGLPPLMGGLAALLGIFAPGFLLLSATLPVWARLTRHPAAARVIAGINAAVVGLLAAAFIHPVCSEGLRNYSDGFIALVGFVLLARLRVSPLWIVLWCTASAIVVSMFKLA